MLLEELHRKTPDGHVDKQSLYDAKMALEAVMIKLDHDITAQDLREKFLNMSSKFKGADVCPSRLFSFHPLPPLPLPFFFISFTSSLFPFLFFFLLSAPSTLFLPLPCLCPPPWSIYEKEREEIASKE